MLRTLQIPGYGYAAEYLTVTSTMDLAREWIGTCENCDTPALFIAHEQTAGRGRQGRKWSSPPGSALMATFVFPCPRSIALLGGYSLAAGVGILQSLSEITEELTLKWPNDLISYDRLQGFPSQEHAKKVGGILIEVIPKGREHMIALGLGINVLGVPEDLKREAGSLLQIAKHATTVNEALRLIAIGLLSVHHEFMEGGFTAFRDRWIGFSCFRRVGDCVTNLSIDTGSEVIEGIFGGVTDIGALVIETGGVMKEVHSGHVLYWGRRHDQ